jgi:uncharacterized membrane protein YdbT with pleckstrin-like domain
VTVLIVSFALNFHNYYLSLQIVTNQRIVDIDQKGLFNREVNELPLANIQDVSHKLNGFLGTIFNFGNVIIQTAGEGGAGGSKSQIEDSSNGFVFNNVPRPSKVSRTILDLYHMAQEESISKNAKAIRQAFQANPTDSEFSSRPSNNSIAQPTQSQDSANIPNIPT